MMHRAPSALVCLLTGLLCFVGAFPATAESDSPLRTIDLQSAALAREVKIHVLVPSDPAPDERFPTLYVLHGAMGGSGDWVQEGPRRAFVLEMAAAHRAILVFPEGTPFGWYVDSPVDANSQVETHFVRELIPAIDALFPTRTDRHHRGIMGLSMGGHGAITLAAKHPDLFGSASSMSGILDLTAHPKSWQIPQRLGSLDDNRALWEANSALQLAPRFRDADVRLLADCGIDDTLERQTGALEDGRAFHERLIELDIPHQWHEHAGGHTWTYWLERLPEHLEFHAAAWNSPIQATNQNPERE